MWKRHYLQGNSQTSYLTPDSLGTPRVVTDSTGTVKARHDYLPFGEEITASVGARTTSLGYVVDSVRQKFTGYERDNETRLDYAQARYYSSTQGRFTSPDPLLSSAQTAAPQSWNRYAYVGSNPLAYIDPEGMSTVSLSQQLQQQQQQQDIEAQTRAQFPTFNQADQQVVNQAIGDAEDAVAEPAGETNTFDLMLITHFRLPGDTTTPTQAIDHLDATSGFQVTRDAQGNLTSMTTEQNVFDGRTSQAPVNDDSGNPMTDAHGNPVTVAQYFRNNSSVNAITSGGTYL
jgi:RHS repeat-associated protein